MGFSLVINLWRAPWIEAKTNGGNKPAMFTSQLPNMLGWEGPDSVDDIVCLLQDLAVEYPEEIWSVRVIYTGTSQMIRIIMKGSAAIQFAYIGPVLFQDVPAIEEFVSQRFRKIA